MNRVTQFLITKLLSVFLMAFLALQPTFLVAQVYAQEASNSAEVTVSPTPEVSASPEVSPSLEPSAQPSVSPEIITTPNPTLSPTPEVSPSPTPADGEKIERERYPLITPITSATESATPHMNEGEMNFSAVPSTVVASPAAGPHAGPIYVTLTSSGSTSIRYTIDGSTPTCSTGTIYTAPVYLQYSMNVTLKAIGCNTDGGSSVFSGEYSIFDAPYTWYLAEGYVGGANNFQTNILVHNAANTSNRVDVTYLVQNGTNLTETYEIPTFGRVTVQPPASMVNKSFSTRVTSYYETVIERSMYWDVNGVSKMGGHTSQAVSAPATTWYLAEGFIGGTNNFKTNVLIQNPQNTDANITVTYMVQETGELITDNRTVSANSRITVGPPISVLGKSFSTKVESDLGIIVERTMYWDSNGIARVGGTASQGITTPATTWYLPEGYIGGASNFKTNILLQNPQGWSQWVTVTYMVQGEGTIEQQHSMGPNSRLTVGPPVSVLGKSFSTKIVAQYPVITERAMYWSSGAVSRKEGHAAAGISTLNHRLALADGYTGGTNNFKTNVLIQNPNNYAFTVYLAYYKADGTYNISSAELPANSRVTVGPGSVFPGEYVSTWVISLDSNNKFAVERTMYWDAGGYSRAGGTAASATVIPG